MRAIIDGDVVAYQSAAMGTGTGGHVHWGEDLDVDQGNLGTSLDIIREKMAWFQRQPKISEVIVALSHEDGSNFRKEICPHYKKDRSEKPDDYTKMVEWLRHNFKCYSFPRLEGDDVMGLLMTGTQGAQSIGYSSDKDMYTIPGAFQRYPQDKQPRKSSLREADLYWMTQTITGDTTDGYKGAPGAGKVRAEKALDGATGLRQVWDRVLHVYADQFDHKRWGKEFTQRTAYDEALMNARCARILRHGDYNFETGEIKLWLP